jgi:hypothetical protein
MQWRDPAGVRDCGLCKPKAHEYWTVCGDIAGCQTVDLQKL